MWRKHVACTDVFESLLEAIATFWPPELQILTAKRATMKAQLAPPTTAGLESLADDLCRLRRSAVGADVVFVVGADERTRWHAHSQILAARCGRLQLTTDVHTAASALYELSGQLTPAHTTTGAPCRWTVKLPTTISAPVVNAFLHYVYTGRLDFSASQSGVSAGTQSHISDGTQSHISDGTQSVLQSAAQLYCIASSLRIPSLCVECCQCLTINNNNNEQPSLSSLCCPHTLSVRQCVAALSFVLNWRQRARAGRERGREQTQPPTGVESADTQTIIESLCNWLGHHTAECLETTECLQLPSSVIGQIISCNQTSLDTGTLWRAVVRWARRGTSSGSDQAARDPTSVAEKLAQVVDLVSPSLKECRVFTAEIMPLISLSGSGDVSEMPASPINTASRSFANAADGFSSSRLLAACSAEQLQQLNSWAAAADGSCSAEWRVLFRASQHSFCARQFHRLCDGVAPLYIVFQSELGALAGAFTDVPFTPHPSPSSVPVDSRGPIDTGPSITSRYIQSERAFLFRLASLSDAATKLTQFPVQKRIYALCYHAQCGPIFGAGADLYIADGCHANRLSYSNMAHSYASPPPGQSVGAGPAGESAEQLAQEVQMFSLAESYNFTVTEYEVLTCAT